MTSSQSHISLLTAGVILALLFFSLAADAGAKPSAGISSAQQADSVVVAKDSVVVDSLPAVRKVLFLGDSMTGWMAERLNAYGEKNGFEVATVVWDGSTISKWAKSPNLRKLIERAQPDAILVSLGMNEMFERNPQTRLDGPTSVMLEAFGDTPFLWIGPPSWPGHAEAEAFNEWMEGKLGSDRYFRSSKLDLQRQSRNNPHPTRKGIEQWIDSVAAWIPGNSVIRFESLEDPGAGKVSRGKEFIYKRMKERL